MNAASSFWSHCYVILLLVQFSEDPLVPASRVELRSWSEAYKDNIKMIQKYQDDKLLMADLDIAIVGESAVEEMDGRWMGRRPDDELKSIGTIFQNHFHKDKGAQVEGMFHNLFMYTCFVTKNSFVALKNKFETNST